MVKTGTVDQNTEKAQTRQKGANKVVSDAEKANQHGVGSTAGSQAPESGVERVGPKSQD